MRSLPWFTVGVGLLVLAIAAVPGAQEALALDRAVSGEPWRWWTGHLSHFSWNHLGWDLAVWGVLGAWLETRSRGGLVAVAGLGAVAISAAFWLALPELTSYRGLSGLDAALSAAAIVELWRTGRGAERWLPGALAALLAGKVAYEVVTGQTLFADDTGWVAVPLAHAVGALVGGVVWNAGAVTVVRSGGEGSDPCEGRGPQPPVARGGTPSHRWGTP